MMMAMTHSVDYYNCGISDNGDDDYGDGNDGSLMNLVILMMVAMTLVMTMVDVDDW